MKTKDDPDAASKFHASFKDKYNEFQNNMKEKNKDLRNLRKSLKGKTGAEKDAIEADIQTKEKEINDEWEKFFKADMKDYVDNVGDKIDLTEKAKDNEIDRLK
jgi:ribosomal protein L16 Arg81 hydroxylase